MLLLAATLVCATLPMTAIVTATVAAPRLELRRVDMQPADNNGQRIAEIQLTLINEGPRPVEVQAHPGIVPKITGPDGKAVVLSDFRNVAGYAPPALPPDPEPPVRTGERRLLESYGVARAAQGYQFFGPFGGALLSPGRYRITANIQLAPVTRQAWVQAHAAAVMRPGKRPKDPQAEAERAAAKFEAHWQKVADYFHGPLETPPLDLLLP